MTTRIGIIGGSGLQSLPILGAVERLVDTPFGAPSDTVLLGELGGVPVAFLRRHGPGHTIPPSAVNARANVAALRHVGSTVLLSVSAVGALDERCPPGSVVLADQFIDRTSGREKSFFGPGLVGHVGFADPTCGRVRAVLAATADALVIPVSGGTYVVMDGPQFSTRAESRLHRSWGGTVIGMTAMPEAKLAREAELCYAMIAVPTDFDCGGDGHDPVSAGLVARRMAEVTERVVRLIERACPDIARHSGRCPDGCDRALDAAIMTHPDSRDPAAVARLAFVVPRVSSAAFPEGE